MDRSRRSMHGVALLLSYILLAYPGHGYAQLLSLTDAVQKTLQNYPQIRQRQSEMSAGLAHVQAVNGNRLPSLTLQDQVNMGTNNGLQGGYFSLGIVPSSAGGNSAAPTHLNPNAGNIAIGFLQWELFNFGYFGAQRRQARAQFDVSEAQLGSDRYLLTENVVALYLDWLKKFRLVKIQNENVQRAQLMLNAIRATVMSGLKPGVDSSTASATYSDARLAYLQARDGYETDRIALLNYMGFQNTAIQPDTLLPLLREVTSGGDSVTDSHPLLAVYKKQLELQLADNRAIAAKYLPKVGLDAATWVRSSGISYSGTYPETLTAGFPYSKYNYLLGLTVSYNLFDIKHRHDQQAEGKYMADARQSAVEQEKLQLARLVEQTNNMLATTKLKLQEMPVQLNSARQAYNQQLALYRSGLNTLLEVTNAQYALLQAETNDVIIHNELLQLLFIRAGLTGDLDIFLQNFKH